MAIISYARMLSNRISLHQPVSAVLVAARGTYIYVQSVYTVFARKRLESPPKNVTRTRSIYSAPRPNAIFLSSFFTALIKAIQQTPHLQLDQAHQHDAIQRYQRRLDPVRLSAIPPSTASPPCPPMYAYSTSSSAWSTKQLYMPLKIYIYLMSHGLAER